jgi:hypothetical protein
MKMRIRRLLLFSLTIFLLVSFTFKNDLAGISGNSNNSISADTSLAKTRIKVTAFDLKIIPPSSGIQYYRDGIVFLSSSKFEEKMVSNQISFWKTEARYALLKDSIIENKQVFSPSLSFPYPCEAVTFNRDYNTMFYTRFSKSYGTVKIYKATYSQSEGKPGFWSFDESPLNFCEDKYTYTHPALSADGKLMIFASDRPGSIGGMDLFASQEKGGSWSEPVNLGDAVNSTSNELFPFLDSENNLFFSSDGVQGYGGYDIYVCKFKSNTWDKPINLSLPVNTRYDDVAFKIDRKDGKSAFYTVKQNTGEKTAQLYRVQFESNNPDSLLTLSQLLTKPDISRMVILVLEPAVQATDKKAETAESKTSGSTGGKEMVTYRVQFMTSFNPRTRSRISVKGTDYDVYEFLYSGAYRLCISEFTTLAPAFELQNYMRKNGYPQANVVAFKNNVLSLDPELLKVQTNTSGLPSDDKNSIPGPPDTVKPPEKVLSGLAKEQKESETRKIDTTKIAAPLNNEKSTVKTVTSGNVQKTDLVVYRIQFLANDKPKGTIKVTVNGKIFESFEYYYAGAYRYTLGEFSTLSAATDFQKSVRQAGYPQAFVVAFKNGTRSTDPLLFK